MRKTRKNLYENLALALDTLRTHKFRSALTVLGVLIGVATIILVGSILVGLESSITSIATQYGTRNIYIAKFPIGINVQWTPEMRRRKALTYDDAMDLRSECPDLEDAIPELVNFQGTPPVVKYKSEQMVDANLAGDMPDIFGLLDISIAQGRAYTEIDNWHRRSVVDIGSDVAKTLFHRENPVGKHIVIGGHVFQVIGVLTERKEFLVDTGDNRIMFIPYNTYHEIYPGLRDNFILAKAYPGRLAPARDEVVGVLRRLRQDKPGKPDSFSTATAQTFVRQFNAMIATLALTMIVISAIGLLIGGIGVMNIMLVSVTERTREIGVRKAIGARQSDISWQFLLEAMTLTGLGGVAGIIVGYVGALAMRLAFPKLPTGVPLWAVIVALVVSVGVGLFFGLWPATKAARLNPIEALRYE
jgi:putative ABC transport system permease protein